MWVKKLYATNYIWNRTCDCRFDSTWAQKFVNPICKLKFIVQKIWHRARTILGCETVWEHLLLLAWIMVWPRGECWCPSKWNNQSQWLRKKISYLSANTWQIKFGLETFKGVSTFSAPLWMSNILRVVSKRVDIQLLPAGPTNSEIFYWLNKSK